MHSTATPWLSNRTRPSITSSALDRVAELLAVAIVLPLLLAIAGGVRHAIEIGAAEWWGTKSNVLLLLSTATLAAMAATYATIAAWLVARSMARASDRTAFVVGVMCCVPLLMPASVMGSAWIATLGRTGFLTSQLSSVFGDDVWTIYDRPIAALAIGLRYFGPAVLLLSAAQRRARHDAAVKQAFNVRPSMTLMRLRVRELSGAVVASWAIVFLLSAQDHILPGLFLIHTYGTQLLIEYQSVPDANAAASLALVPALVGVIGAYLLLRSWRSRFEPSGAAINEAFVSRRGRAVVGHIVATCVIAIAVFMPLLVTAWRAQSVTQILSSALGAKDELRHTALLAIAGAIGCTLAAILLARHWIEATRRGRWSLVPVILIVLLTPPSLLAIGVIRLFELQPLVRWRGTNVPLIVGYVARFTPLATLLLYAMWSNLSDLPRQAAIVHGVSRAKIAWRILRPPRTSAALAAAALCALLIATELDVSVLLTPPGVTTAAVRLDTLVHTAPDKMVAALSTALTVLASTMIVFTGWMVGRASGEHSRYI